VHIVLKLRFGTLLVAWRDAGWWCASQLIPRLLQQVVARHGGPDDLSKHPWFRRRVQEESRGAGRVDEVRTRGGWPRNGCVTVVLCRGVLRPAL
jgi:hypothetical protein